MVCQRLYTRHSRNRGATCPRHSRFMHFIWPDLTLDSVCEWPWRHSSQPSLYSQVCRIAVADWLKFGIISHPIIRHERRRTITKRALHLYITHQSISRNKQFSVHHATDQTRTKKKKAQAMFLFSSWRLHQLLASSIFLTIRMLKLVELATLLPLNYI